MSTRQPDLRAQWVSDFFPPLAPPRATGLIDQLLEEGRIVKEFNMPDATYRVATNFHLGQESCFFRSAVLRNGVELDTDAWAPIFRNLNELVSGREGDPEAKLQVARLALESHLGFCSRVGRRLEEKGTLTESSRRILWAGGIGALILAAGLGVWFGIERHRTRVDDGIKARLESGSKPEAAPIPEIGAVPDSESAIDTDSAAETVSPSESGPDSEAAPARAAPPPKTRAVQTSPQVAEPAKALPPPPVEPAEPEPREERSPITATEPPPSPHVRALVTGIGPEDRRVVTISVGEELFEDTRTRVSDVPQLLEDVSCVTTQSYDGGEISHFSIRVAVPVRVFVAHDRRVKRKPDWLDTFRSTGATLTASELGSKDIVFDVFRRDFEGGAFTLGPNTQMKKVTRKLREIIPKRQAMYLVCVIPRT